MQQETVTLDVLIVGAGPAGLSTAIHLAQLAQEKKQTLNIAVIEKSSEVGGHVISGAILETAALAELLPNWRDLDLPMLVPVKTESFCYLSQQRAYQLPRLATLQNRNNHIISLGELCRYLADYASQLGITLFTGFAAQKLLFDEQNNTLIGVESNELGRDKKGKKTANYQAGVRLLAKQTVFAEGTRGHLTQQLIKRFKLDQNKQPQTYALGLKELWQISPKYHQLGKVMHTVGWPLNSKTYGGGFIYHFKDHLLSLGLVVGLDYQNPYLDPFQELQRFKQHPCIKPLLISGKCMHFGARALNEGGWQSLPKLSFAGGLLVGCAAGMVNVAKIKGIHNALRSGMMAAKAISQQLDTGNTEISDYQTQFNQSIIAKELKKVRNLRPAFHRGLWSGLSYAAIDQGIFHGYAPWTLRHHADHLSLKAAAKCPVIHYPAPDRQVSFDKLTQLALSSVQHREDQPSHLQIKNNTVAQATRQHYHAPETRYCPAGVYEWITKDEKTVLQINASNCLHCKSCDIKDPEQNIVWQAPEGSGGPGYRFM